MFACLVFACCVLMARVWAGQRALARVRALGRGPRAGLCRAERARLAGLQAPAAGRRARHHHVGTEELLGSVVAHCFCSSRFDQCPQEWKDKDNVAVSDNKRLGKFDRPPLMKLAREWLDSPPKPAGKVTQDPTKKQFYLELDDW